MTASAWLVILLWGGLPIGGSLLFLGLEMYRWLQAQRRPVDSFARQRAESARWMRENWVGLEHWWRPDVLTDRNPNPSPRLSYDVATYIFNYLAKRGLLLAREKPVRIEDGSMVPILVYQINPGRESEWDEIVNIDPLHVFWRKHGMAIFLTVSGALLGAILGFLFGRWWGP